MPRKPVASDAFNAVAEPARRDILVFLAAQERSVGEIVVAVRLSQPSVSKHLHVLRQTGLVRARRHGRHMYYRAEGGAIRPLHEWAGLFERFWQHQLAAVKQLAESPNWTPPKPNE